MKITKNSLIKALRTFIQSAVAYLAVNCALIDFSDSKQAIRTALTGLGVSAVSAGLCAVMNLEKKGVDSDDNG